MSVTVTRKGSGDALYFQIDSGDVAMIAAVRIPNAGSITLGQNQIQISKNITTNTTATPPSSMTLGASQSGETYTFTAASQLATVTEVQLIAPWGAILATVTVVDGTTPTGGSGSVPCFLADAPVLTPSGYKPISSLKKGDKVCTADNRVVRIMEVAHYQVPATKTTCPYVIPAGQFGATQDLHISPQHRVMLTPGGKLVEAQHIDGLRQDSSITGTIDYYNLELPNWSRDNMVVAGVTVESKARIERYVISSEEFIAMCRQQYGEISPALLEKAQQTCRILENGKIEVPVIRRR